MYGAVGAIIGSEPSLFCLPLDMDIQDGLADTSSWDSSGRNASHVVQMVRNAYSAAGTFGSSYLVLDRYFLTAPALAELDRLNQQGALLDIITRAKTSCTAYEPPQTCASPKRGRPRKKGDAVKLQALFQERASDFTRAEAMMYGKKETVEYLCLDLLWGTKLYKKLRFVLVKSARGNCILACTDLSMAPLLIIEVYAHRFKIECTFREFKQQVGGFCYHFWTKAMPKLNRYRKKGEPSELSHVSGGQERQRILKTIDATERFVLCASIAMGLTQMMGLTLPLQKPCGSTVTLGHPPT